MYIILQIDHISRPNNSIPFTVCYMFLVIFVLRIHVKSRDIPQLISVSLLPVPFYLEMFRYCRVTLGSESINLSTP